MPAKKTPLDDVQTVLKGNLLIQYASLVPIIAISLWLFGFYYTWGSLLVVALGYSIRYVAYLKGEFYTNFTTEVRLTHNKREIQHCAWLNLIVRKYWTTCVPKFVEPEIIKVNAMMLEKKPAWVKKLEINPWNLGDRAPRITQIYTPIILSDDRYELEFEILWVPDASVTVEVAAGIGMKVVASEVKFKGRMKLTFNLNDLFPECSIVSVSFIEDPLIELSIRPVSPLDLVSVPLVYELIHETLRSNLRPMLVAPNELQFTMGGGQVETYANMEEPITDIVVIYSETSKAPSGYVLLQRTTTGMLPANLNSGNPGKQMYICYKREEGKPAITGVAVFYPGLGELPPEGFEAIEETPSAENGSLNAGNVGHECFLCVERAKGANPITGLALINENEDYILPEDFRVLELSPNGHKANLNKKAGGDRLFVAYKGGHDSFFGFVKPCTNANAGLLRVEVVEARNLVAADLGGTSDPFVEVVVGDEVPKKGVRNKFTEVIDKTLSPLWDEVFIFSGNRNFSVLTLNVYDKDKIAISSTHLGRIQLNLDTLVMGKQVDQWIPLQMVPKGEVRIRVLALNFGLPADQEPAPFQPRTVNQYNSQGFLGGLPGFGMKGVGAVAGIGGMGVGAVTSVGGMGVDAVSAVGGAGLKGVTNAGELGVKGVTAAVGGVTGAVGGITGAVGGLFSSSSSKKKKEAEKSEKSAEHSEAKSPRNKGGFFGLKRSHDAPDHDTITKDEIVPVDAATLQPAPDTRVVDRTPTTREGHVKEAGGLGFGIASHKVFAKLTTDSLHIYKSSKDPGQGKEPKEIYPLGEIQLGVSDEKHSFTVVRAGAAKNYKCASDEEVQQWLIALNNNKQCLSTA